MSASILDGPLVKWMLTTTTATTYPTTGQGVVGGAAGTAGNILLNARKVQIVGFLVTTAGATTATVVNAAATSLGIVFQCATVGVLTWFGEDGPVYEADNAEIGITSSGAGVGIFFFRRMN